MRVALIAPYPEHADTPRGGVEAVTVTLARALVDLGVEVLIVDPFTGSGRSKGVIASYEVIRPTRVSAWCATGTKVPHEVLEAVSEWRADVVHLHLAHPWARTLPFPTVATVHGVASLEVRHRHGYLKATLASVRHRRALHLGVRAADAVIAISAEIAAIAGAAGGRCFSVPNPVDEAFYAAVPSRGRDYVAVGGVHHLKNQLMLIKAFIGHIEAGRDGNLLLVGPVATDAYADQCREVAASAGERVQFVGSLDRFELVNVLRGARCVVSTSLRETSSMAIAEALAAGVPVVSSPVGDAEAIFARGDAGVMLPEDFSVASVKNALARIETGDYEAEQLRTLVAHRAPRAVASETVAIYSRVINRTVRSHVHGS